MGDNYFFTEEYERSGTKAASGKTIIRRSSRTAFANKDGNAYTPKDAKTNAAGNTLTDDGIAVSILPSWPPTRRWRWYLRRR